MQFKIYHHKFSKKVKKSTWPTDHRQREYTILFILIKKSENKYNINQNN